MAGNAKTFDVDIWRGNDKAGEFVRYQVPSKESQTVLDVVTWIQRNLEPNLGYRFACRVGMCGSCSMLVNGKPRWTCRTHVNKVLKDGMLQVAPMRNLPVIKDLVVDMTNFFKKWVKAESLFRPTTTREEEIEAISPNTKERRAASAAIECINCGVCYSACDVVEKNPDYLGPAALNRAWTLVNDQRDGARDERLKAVTSDGGCQNCHSQQGCATYCPNLLNPTKSIAGLKRAASMAALKGEI